MNNNKNNVNNINKDINNDISITTDTIDIVGFKAIIKDIPNVLSTINNISKSACNCNIQLIDADAVASYKHVYHGTVHAINAFARGNNLAKDLGIEIAIRISAQRQISKAMDLIGLKEGAMNLAIIMVNCPDYFIDEIDNVFDGFNRDDSVLNSNNDIKLADIYNISSSDLSNNSIEDILIEKTTMLIVDV
ncbi:MAG: KEOPS complex subunit Cgi121 [Methanobacteriaceae archaeon]